ncbi:hypothetical protein BX600DRAFT_550616 [Xylariales sp. PMI_506]|nr:hypothetical protein BX600DRAFT_550616 [Xylariales sp. PMI_506]
MSKFQLHVNIDSKILDTGSKDKLVIARMVNGSLNTVFDGFSIAPNEEWKQLYSSNPFEWYENFSVCLIQKVEEGAKIDDNNPSTNKVNIEIGDLTTYEKSQLSNPVKQASGHFDKPGCFGIKNVPMQLHAAVQMSTSNGGWATIYVDRDPHVGTESIQLQPQNDYILMWKEEVSTEAIWALAETDGKKITFPPGTYSQTVRYGYAIADHPQTGEAPTWY